MKRMFKPEFLSVVLEIELSNAPYAGLVNLTFPRWSNSAFRIKLSARLGVARVEKITQPRRAACISRDVNEVGLRY